MKKYRLYINDVLSNNKYVDHDGKERFVENLTLLGAMDEAFMLAQSCSGHSYRLMEGGAAQYKLTAAFASWWL